MMQVRKKTVKEALMALLDIERRTAAIYRHFALQFKEDGSSVAWEKLAIEEDSHATAIEEQIEWVRHLGSREITRVASEEIDRLSGQFAALEPLALKEEIEPAEAVALAQALEASVNEGNIAGVLAISVPELKDALGSVTEDCMRHIEFVGSIARKFYEKQANRALSA